MTLPPLPSPTVGLGAHCWSYGADDMRAYAEQAVAAERERCIDIVAMFGGSVEIEAAIRRAE